MIKLVLAALCSLSLAVSTRAGEPGTAGANFLQIGAGPRGVAMGEAQTAVADDAYATYWNPAGLSRIRWSEVALMHNQMSQAVAQQYLAYVQPVSRKSSMAGSLTRLSVESIESYDATGARRGTVDTGDLSVSLAYGRVLADGGETGPEVRGGVGGRWIQEQLAGVKAATFAGDAGLLIGRLDGVLGDRFRGVRLGLSVRNVGPGLKFYQDAAPLPRVLAAGVAWEAKPWGDPMILSADVKQSVDEGVRPSFGGEYWVRRVLALRAGYVVGQDTGLGLRFGLGVRLKRVMIEYAMAGFGGIGDMHRFGFSYRFGGPADLHETTANDYITRGRDYLQQNRYYEAVTQFNRALEVDPGNRLALEYMRRALKAMEKPVAPNQEKENAR